MPCPHWSKRHHECILVRELASDGDEDLEVQEVEKFQLAYCLSETAFLTCPTFKRHLIEQARAY
jgi:hypothetical protein